MVIVYILVQVLFLNQGDGKMLKERKKERKKENLLVYQKEDFSEVTFGVSKIDSSIVNYYYEIKSDIRGERHEN